MHRFWTLLGWLLLASSAAAQTAVDDRYSGSWYQPDRSGEGWILQVLPDGSALVYWFTYPPLGEPGEQAWIFAGGGAVDGDSIRFDNALTTRGARFGDAFDPADVELQAWGTLEFEFVDCASGRVDYAGPSTFGSGSFEIRRLTSIEGQDCAASPAKSVQAGHSGAWYDPDRSGEGWLLEALDDQRAALYWFGYDLEGNQAWFVGSGIRDRDTVVVRDLLRPTGPRFGSAFDVAPLDPQPWGALSLLFTDCNAGVLGYDALDPAFGGGTLLPARLTALAGSSCQPPPERAEVEGSWSEGTALPVALTESGYTTHRGRAYLAGGAPGGTTFLEYDGASASWRQLPDLPAPRDHVLVAGFEDSIYVFGGYIARQFESVRTVWRFDLDSLVWHSLPDLPYSAAAGGAAVVNNRIHVLGSNRILQEFNPLDGGWRQLPIAPRQRDHAQLVAFRGELWNIGGRSEALLFNSVDIFDPATSTWRAGPAMRGGRSGFAAAVAADQLMVAGGEALGETIGGSYLINSFEVLAAEAEGWRSGPVVPVATHGVGAAGLDGRFHLFGGSTVPGALNGAIRSNFIYTPR